MSSTISSEQTSYVNKHEPGDFAPQRPATGYAERKTVKIGFCEVPLFLANLFFAFLVVAGHVGQKVSLPLWVDCTNGNSSGPTVDSYFVLSFASLSYVVIFGLGTLLIRVLSPQGLGETERRFPHRLLFLVGFLNALSGLLIVFTSKGARTPPYLQALLGNFLIPLTVLFRFVVLRKRPTRLKLLCAIAVFVSLFVCLIPTIFPSVDPKAKETANEVQEASRVIWPIIFMLGFLPGALMIVLSERGVKMESQTSKKGINLVYFLFWTSTYQLLCVATFFWADILPWYGNVGNINEFGKNWRYGIQCFFGGAGCSATPGIRGIVFIVMYVLFNVGSANLMRHAEGAAWLAIVTSLATPLGFIFWTLFDESPFKWHPQDHVSTWFSIGALAMMVPAIFVYNMGTPEISLSPDGNSREEFLDSYAIDDYHSVDHDELTREPLISSAFRSTSYSGDFGLQCEQH